MALFDLAIHLLLILNPVIWPLRFGFAMASVTTAIAVLYILAYRTFAPIVYAPVPSFLREDVGVLLTIVIVVAWLWVPIFIRWRLQRPSKSNTVPRASVGGFPVVVDQAQQDRLSLPTTVLSPKARKAMEQSQAPKVRDASLGNPPTTSDDTDA